MQIQSLLCVALASGAMAQYCQAGADYCGWYLNNTIGWKDVPDLEGIWHCNADQYSASYVEHCAFNCTGPIAACAAPPGNGASSTTTTTTTTTEPTWTKPAYTTKSHWSGPY